MKTWSGLESIHEPFVNSAVAIGQFDGLHVGHQALIGRAVEEARRIRGRSVVFTFDRHPMDLIAPDRAPSQITTLEQRSKLIEECGVDDLVIAKFDNRFRDLSPETFLHFVLVGVLGAASVSVGHDFRFGCNQLGDVDFMNLAESRFRFKTNVIESVMVLGEKASSTRVRTLLRDGNVTDATQVLGRPFALIGIVVHGQQLGRTLGFPTANLATETKQLLPKDGVYAVLVNDGTVRRQGACSIGLRPTVNGKERTVETFLFDFDGDLYGQKLEFEFVERIRDEEKFNSLDELVTAMHRDVALARQVLRCG